MPTLFNIGENSDTDEELKINKDYANSYNNWRQKEEFNKLKTKYGDVNGLNGSSEDDSGSESSSEDEAAEVEITEQFDKEFYKTLACLKKKDPKIYDTEVQFFNETNQAQESKKQKSEEKQKKEKAVFLRDYERKIIVERDGVFSDDEELPGEKKKMKSNLTYVEEQKQLKDSFKHALVDEDQADDTDLLVPKSKSKKEVQKEEADYKEWLKGQRLEIDAKEKEELKPLRDFWTNPDLDANEKFLRDYILNNKYLDTNYPSTSLDYEQVIHDSDENLSEDERNIEKQEEFEHKYNFRFEEPDKDFIKRYPRTMENSLRKKDTRRAQKRAEVKQRKDEEKLRKKEELMQLKALKRKEIEEKIEKLREITGNDDIKFNDVDLEEDFDPSEHDRKMMEIFNDDFYAVPEDDNKPEFPEIDEELEIEGTWDNYEPNADSTLANDQNAYEEPHCEDADFNMDADYDGSQSAQTQNVEGKKKRKGRRRSKFAELLQKEKPKYDPKKYQSYEEYFDKYYSLDYEDMIGDLPCRFKYRKVVPNDYGLSVEEILMADDKELNKWCSLRNALKYKPEHMELNDVRSYKQKAANEALKKKVLRSLYAPPEEEKDEEISTPHCENGEAKKKRRKKKKGHANDIEISVGEADNTNSSRNNEESEGTKGAEVQTVKTFKAQKRKQKSNDSKQSESKKCKLDESEAPKVETEKSDEPSNSNSSNSEFTAHKSSKPAEDSKKKGKSKKKKKFGKNDSSRKRNGETNGDVASLNPERLKTYGINPKKLKNKLKYGSKQH